MKDIKTITFRIILILTLGAMIFPEINALPSQPVLTYLSNTTSNSAGVGQARDGDKGGYITTIALNASQQNYAWKAYVGNVTGRLVLEDQDQFSIYEWNMQVSAIGNVYISRNGTVNWASINCSNDSLKISEDTFLNLNPTSQNSINRTFSNRAHKNFKVAGKTYQNSSCYSIATYVNDSSQVANESAKYQEILLSDTSNLVYMTILEQTTSGFDNEGYNFQSIVGEDETKENPTRYYFYVELEG